MMKLTEYQKDFMRKNKPKTWAKGSIVFSVLLVVSVVGFYFHEFGEAPDWVGTLSVMGFVAYIVLEWIGAASLGIIRGVIFAHDVMMKAVADVDADDDLTVADIDGVLNKIRRDEFQKTQKRGHDFFDKLLELRRFYGQPGFISRKIYEWSLDLIVLGLLIVAGWPVLAVFHILGEALQLIFFFSIQKRVIKYVRTKESPLGDENENVNIDTLADQLFHGDEELP